MYHRQLSRFDRFFPPEQILILKAEDMYRDPAATFRRCFSFLDVDPELEPRLPAPFRQSERQGPRLQRRLRDAIGRHFPDVIDASARMTTQSRLGETTIVPDLLHHLVENLAPGREEIATEARDALRGLFACRLGTAGRQGRFPY